MMRGKVRRFDEIWAVGTARARSRLLDPGIHREWRSAHNCGDVEELPSAGERPSERTQKADAVERENLNHARRENAGYVEGRRPLFRIRIPRVLRESLEDDAGCTQQPAQHGTRVVERLRVGVARL